MQNLVSAWNPSCPVLLFKKRPLTLLGFQWGTHEKLNAPRPTVNTGNIENSYANRLAHTLFKWRSVVQKEDSAVSWFVFQCKLHEHFLFASIWGLTTCALIQTLLSPLPKQIHKAANQIFKCLSRWKSK